MTELADVYALDMGRRTIDKDMWLAEFSKCTTKPQILEVGWGDGRLSRLCGDHASFWFGIEIDPDIVPDQTGEKVAVYLADAATEDVWVDLKDELIFVDLVIIPYSTLYLIPHAQQIAVIQHALGVAPKVLVEVFVPQWTSSGSYVQLGACASPEGDDRMWARRSEFTVDAATQTTKAVRTYGPVGQAYVHQLEETIYWRMPSDLQSVVAAAGLKTDLRSGAPVPAGHVLLEVTK
jgi:hypothetical protein